MVIHQRIHNGAQPFNCKLCERSFSQVGNLHTHLRRHVEAAALVVRGLYTAELAVSFV
jgi:hypothetical protein